jgi:hypothetical protein
VQTNLHGGDSEVCGMDLDFNNALDGLQDTISIFYFSNFTSKDIVPPKAQNILANVLFGKIVDDMQIDYNMTTRENIVFGCLKVAHAQDFLLVIHIDGLGQHMSQINYRTIFRYCVMILLFLKDEICHVCRKVSRHF